MIIMGKKKVFLRGVDENLYARVKARASLLGITVSEAINLALKAWLSTSFPETRGFSPKDYGGAGSGGFKDKKGVLVVVNGGEEERVFEGLDDALKWLRRLYRDGSLRSSTIRFLGLRKPPRFLEIGGGGIEVRREI